MAEGSIMATDLGQPSNAGWSEEFAKLKEYGKYFTGV